jgi:hypothetical protein
MEKNIELNGRVLARVVAEDLTTITGGLAKDTNTCTVTGAASGGLNGSDITNTGGDGDI